jgi:CheY-like chemotaxis protein
VVKLGFLARAAVLKFGTQCGVENRWPLKRSRRNEVTQGNGVPNLGQPTHIYIFHRRDIETKDGILCMPERAVILLAENSEDDIVLVLGAFKRANILNPIHVTRSGEEAIEYLSGVGKYSNRAEYPLPELLLLDLKMPGLDGFDVTRWIRQQPSLNALRIVVLTASDHIRDVNQAYQLGANSFMVKPMEFENYIELSKSIHDYWLLKSKAPETTRPRRILKSEAQHELPPPIRQDD